jgi:hypothetical protein
MSETVQEYGILLRIQLYCIVLYLCYVFFVTQVVFLQTANSSYKHYIQLYG